jgi:hypothetical protein
MHVATVRAFKDELQKIAGVLGALGKAGVGMFKAAPVPTTVAALTLAGGAAAAKGKYKQYQAGFDPAVQRAQMGQAPVPPGVQ